MKLQNIAIGARFEYEGVVYVKTGPLTASSESGGSRLIPRYATLKLVETQVDQGKRHDLVGLDSGAVRAAFDTFYEACNRLVDEGQREALAKARDDFLATLR